MIVTFSSVRGAPGVSSWTLLTAAAWPATDPGSADHGGRAERVVLEADLDGGVYGARYGFGIDPGVSSLAAAVRRESDASRLDLVEVARHVAEGVWLVPGPETAEQAHGVWGSPATAVAVAEAAAGDRRVWLVDAGRTRPGSANFPLVEHAELALLLCRPSTADLVQAPSRIAALQRAARSVGVLVIGKCDYGTAELAEFLGTGLVWQAPAGDELVTLAGAALSTRRARHSWLWRSALDIASGIAARLDPMISPVVSTELSGDTTTESRSVAGIVGDG